MISLRYCLILLSGLLMGGFLHAADSFIQGRPVIVLAGLPGDIESEKNYEDQTRRLLTLLNRPDLAPSKITLLSGLGNFDFKSTVPLQLLSNQRESFLKAATEQTEAPVLIVFGHGGLQGKTPVFHVPGPRLSPEDFAKAGESFPESTWLLFFPGSGSFAKSLQGPKRLILATESSDKTFKQDPVSFPLFLDLLKKENDLLRISQQLGVATERWYKDRSIARTEEPSLWAGAEPPQKLVELAEASVEAKTSPPSATAAPENSEAWAGIKAVDPRDYPRADAVLLSKRQAYVIGDNPRVSVEEESFVQILTRDGKKMGDFRVSFSPPDEDLKFLACEVRRPDGTIESLDPNNIHNAGEAKEEDSESSTRFKIFSLPHVEPGAILHVHWQRQWKNFPLPEVFEEIPLAGELPIVKLSVEVRLPEKSAFHYKARNQELEAPQIKKTAYGSIYSWQLNNIPAKQEEPLQGPEQDPALLVSTFPDWDQFSGWYQRLIKEANRPTPEMEAQVKELTRDLKTDREKVAALSGFVTGFRYVAVPLGVNSHRPHSAGSVFQNRYGDCKDKANLLNTMLQSLGYQADLVLVPRFAQAYEEVPGFAFNHAISRVSLKNETLWIDTTDDICRFGFLPPGDPGREVLVINDKIKTLTRLPEPLARDNKLTIQTDLIVASGRSCAVKLSAVGVGYPDYQLRYAAQKQGSSPGTVPLLGDSYRNLSGLLEVNKQEATAVAEMDRDFTWKAEGKFLGLISHVPQTQLRLLRLPAWLPEEWTEAILPRQTPLYLNRGYPVEIRQIFRFHLPANVGAPKLPVSQSGEGDALKWKLSWSSAGSSEVSAELELFLLKADMNQEETGKFQNSCRSLIEALQDGFSFQTL